MMTRPISLVLLFFGLLSSASAQYTPTISGVNAFWWLGSGILQDYGYYAQSALTSNANGAPGTPTWTVQTVAGGGSVSLSCYTCANTTATATAPSNGCVADVTIYVSYGGYQSAAFNVTIVTPTTTTLSSTSDDAWGNGYLTSTWWTLTDSCGYADYGLDGNEVFGTFTADYSPNGWGTPTADNGRLPGYLVEDVIGAKDLTNPTTQNPQSPLGSTAVFHDTPWKFYVGSLSFGSGVLVRSDWQQWYRDHGRHQ